MKGMHMLKINLSRIAGLLLFAFIVFSGVSLYAQKEAMSKVSDTFKQNAEKWTTQLNQKVTLTQEQQTKIEGILVDYQSAKASTDMKSLDQLRTTYNTKIESVLNDNQKTLYKDYSKEWWENMSKPSMQSTEKNKY
jgi:capsular polysaccharide biosynthesis protein